MSAFFFAFISLAFMSDYFLRETSKIINSTFLATYRMLWAVSMAWVIFAFDNGSFKWISWLFNHKLWIPIGKLSLSMYLIHPIVIAAQISSNKQPIDFELLLMVRRFVTWKFDVVRLCYTTQTFIFFSLTSHADLQLPRWCYDSFTFRIYSAPVCRGTFLWAFKASYSKQ